MKRYKLHCLFLFVFALCVCALVGCGKENQVSGEVLEARCDENGTLVSLLIQSYGGERIGVLLTDATKIFPLVSGYTYDEFQTVHLIDTLISASCGRSRPTVMTENNEKIVFYKANEIFINGVINRKAEVLSDGTTVDVIEEMHMNTVYRLTDGTELLRVTDPIGPDNTYVAGIGSYDDLSDIAREKVAAYYEEQGLLYDVHEELEKAYADYFASNSPIDFEPYSLRQEVAPSAYNEYVMYFLTSVMLPIDGNYVEEFHVGAAFDRETGEHIDNWELFACSREEATQFILDAACAWTDDSTLREEMEVSIKSEYIVFFPNSIEIAFPAGTLPSLDYAHYVTIDLDEDLLNILYEWAIPNARE